MLTSVVVCAMLVGQEAKLKLPARPQPLNFGLVKLSQDGKSLAVTKSGPRTETQAYTVNIPMVETREDADGKVTRVTVMRAETRQRKVRVTGLTKKITPIAKCKFTDLNGQPVEGDQLSKRLSKETPVLLWPEGTKLDQFYMSVLRESTLVMSVPPLAIPAVRLRAARPLPRPVAPAVKPPANQKQKAGGGAE